ncbi:cation:proton antiporter [Urbifossiella limnaea]|uniref:High-affinity Na(+)/H(+) antiporter NhaS3 n=1 Tax=Urbifossiella limnaea TaxID=2528023 RepID=A0A517XKV7_9BACT|nr:cation:proton antiporter [Urbifossiella limnaea]QDU18130.1 High-affinity Na(+)/H(+) antiporter NhaS3 [Urbifossiella limnaea]
MNSTLEMPVVRAARPAWVGPLVYVLMLAAGVGVFLLVRQVGASLAAPAAPANAISVSAPKAGQVDVVAHVLATLAAIVGLGFALGRLFRYLGQPPVIGEVIAGILLGPSLLGAISPDAMHLLIPAPADDPKGQVTAALRAVAQLGVVLYMFLVGLELNGAKLKGHAHAAVAISHASIVAPFALGLLLALPLYPRVSHAGVPFVSFALFMGVALSVTAFPVLARILADRGLDRTPAGVIALGCAAADDVTAWCLLALVVGVARAEVGSALGVIAGAAALIAVMFVVVGPLARWACRELDGMVKLPPAVIPILFVLVLLSALATELIGIHAVFGAFLLGAVIPHDSRVAREITRALKDVVTVLLLPAFFALAGLRTELGLLDSWASWGMCAGIILVATLGKFGGTYLAATFTGYDRRTAAALGAMMNTRGLMGLIVLDIGLSLGVISPTLFAMMVLMALATTLATAPALARLLPSDREAGSNLP